MGNTILHVRTWRTIKQRKRQAAAKVVKLERRRRPADQVRLDLLLPEVEDLPQTATRAVRLFRGLKLGRKGPVKAARTPLLSEDELLLTQCPSGARLARIRLRTATPVHRQWLRAWWIGQRLDPRQLLSATLYDKFTIDLLVDARIIVEPDAETKAKPEVSVKRPKAKTKARTKRPPSTPKLGVKRSKANSKLGVTRSKAKPNRVLRKSVSPSTGRP